MGRASSCTDLGANHRRWCCVVVIANRVSRQESRSKDDNARRSADGVINVIIESQCAARTRFNWTDPCTIWEEQCVEFAPSPSWRQYQAYNIHRDPQFYRQLLSKRPYLRTSARFEWHLKRWTGARDPIPRAPTRGRSLFVTLSFGGKVSADTLVSIGLRVDLCNVIF